MLQKTIDNIQNIKYKTLTQEQLLISADRLTRFKETETKYLRVFKDIIFSNLIEPKIKKIDIEQISNKQIREIAEFIINKSLEQISSTPNDNIVNSRLCEYEKNTFICNDDTLDLLNNKINYKALCEIIPNNCPINLKWLKLLSTSDNPEKESFQNGYKFPIKKLIICEGITEEILLPVFANILGYNFDQNGIQILSAGGKNQVVKMFYQYVEELKIPIFVLLDNDAKPNSLEIVPRLRNCDKIHLLEHGEFEDALPVKLIERTLKYATENISELPITHPDSSDRMVHYLEDFFKKRGTHEFKKAEFALMVKENICGLEDVSDEFQKIIEELKAL